jgi:hypothetical protein
MSLNTKFRSVSEVRILQALRSHPASYKNFLSVKEVEWLLHLYNHHVEKKFMKDSYRTSLPMNTEFWFRDELENWVKQKFSRLLGGFDISYYFFYESTTPLSSTDSTVHVDIWNDNTILDKTILIPLYLDPPSGNTNTVLFKQHFYHYGAAYAGLVGNHQTLGSTVILPEHYDKIEDLNTTCPFDKSAYYDLLTHKPYSNFYGLEVDSVLNWQVGSAMVFDRAQLHCCDHYFNLNRRIWFSIWINRGPFNANKRVIPAT